MRKNISNNSSKNWRSDSANVAICVSVYLMLQSCINMPAYHSLDDPFTARKWYENTHNISPKPKEVVQGEVQVIEADNTQASNNQNTDLLDANLQYTVKKSDTLFSIAYKFEIDYRKLASANNIKSPFLIFPGQKIDIKTANSIEDSQVDTNITVVNLPKDFVAPKIDSKPETQEELTTPEVEQNPTVSKNTTPEVATSQNPVNIPTPSNPTKTGASGWNWPTLGTIVRAFNTKGDINKGIDIKGQKGESVLAAATGTIVFVGPGPLGYGQLLIVQHDNQWLSAYSNLDKIVVKEKQIVKASEVIAEIGNDRSGNSILHFEIRRLGKPVDPMLYLPKRE